MTNLDVTIMGQSYRLVCREGEQQTLREAVAYLDAKMSALRDSGKVKGTDRIAVMAALSVAAEFLSILEVKYKLEAMHTVLDSALAPQENLF
jgi:cell division protein ZapA